MTNEKSVLSRSGHPLAENQGNVELLTNVIGDMSMINKLTMPDVIIVGSKPVTTSQSIATYFNKAHDKIVNRIEHLDCSDEFLTRNFRRVKFEHKGNYYRSYEVTKDGFVFLTMGFTGKKAATFKESYINQFNYMADWINDRLDAKDEQKNMSEAIKNYIDRTGDNQHGHTYSNEYRYLNKLVLGVDPIKWAKSKGMDKKLIRDNMTSNQLALLTYLESRDCTLLDLDTPTPERKIKLQELAYRWLNQSERVAA